MDTNNQKESKDFYFKSSWNIYNHIKCDQNDYDLNTQLMGTCSSVFEFWTCYDVIPKPSQLFYQKDTGKPFSTTNIDSKREISSISVFKNGILPKWEDPINKKGGEIEYRLKTETNIDVIDKMWLYLCMYCMAELITNSITGFRLVDSSIIAQSKPLYRVEIWFSDLNEAKQIETIFRDIFKIDPEIKLNMKKHT